MDWLRLLIQRGLRRVDQHYQRIHDLKSAGPVLYVGPGRHDGPVIQFPDGTVLNSGDAIGVMHFNNERFTRIDGTTARSAAIGFARLMMESLEELARLALHDPTFGTVTVFHAVSWLPAHGTRIGFICDPYPEGLKKRWMYWHFKLLVWAFAPARDSRSARPDPHHFWLTRKELLRRFGASRRPRQTDRSESPHADARLA
jgi:hypothetical protein